MTHLKYRIKNNKPLRASATGEDRNGVVRAINLFGSIRLGKHAGHLHSTARIEGVTVRDDRSICGTDTVTKNSRNKQSDECLLLCMAAGGVVRRPNRHCETGLSSRLVSLTSSTT